jgi:transcription termination factor Rho
MFLFRRDVPVLSPFFPSRARSDAAAFPPSEKTHMTDLDVRASQNSRSRRPDAVVDVAGLLDIHGGKAWIRFDGYAPGPGDVAVSLNQVRTLGLRRGDHVTGTAQVAGGRPTTLKLDTVNGGDPAAIAGRPGFYDLTAVHPHDRLRIANGDAASRLIDLVMPIGKGQRALIVAPPKAGKTTVLKTMATAISRNHPDVHVMVLLVDERPEEVTDIRRNIRGEVVAATFDQTPSDHTAVAELAIERAQRMVEGGRDVVVLLDSITRLGRAYNLASAGRGKTLSGGLDSAALHPPKRFLGSARAMEEGGSLTIVATALVENGSAMDTVLFEEFKGTGNAELKLDRTLAEGRLYPAVDVAGSGTRHDELLFTPDELTFSTNMRRALGNQDRRGALQQLLRHLGGSSAGRLDRDLIEE